MCARNYHYFTKYKNLALERQRLRELPKRSIQILLSRYSRSVCIYVYKDIRFSG